MQRIKIKDMIYYYLYAATLLLIDKCRHWDFNENNLQGIFLFVFLILTYYVVLLLLKETTRPHPKKQRSRSVIDIDHNELLKD